MNIAQIHLAFNHFPVVGTILAFGILLWGYLGKKDQIKIVGIALMIISALTAIVAMTSGEGTEEMVEHKPLVTKELIHSHEEAAEASMIAINVTAILCIAWFFMNRLNKNNQEKMFVLILIMTVVSFLLVASAAHKGGMIRHDEIRTTN